MIPDARRHLHLAALASAAMPGLDPRGVAEVYDAGRGHVAVQVVDTRDRRWLVEEPLTPAGSAAEDIVAALLPMLDARLPFDVPRPEASVVLKGEGRITVTRWIDDERIAFDDVPPGPGIAPELGRTLAAIHNLDPAMYDEAGVPVYDAEAYRRRRLSELDRAAATGLVPKRLLARWEEALELVPLWRFAATPCHGSFDGDAVRVHTGTTDADVVVSAVTTWSAARVADPADDFAALYDEAHPDTFDAVMEAYAAARTERPDRGLQTRARLASELHPVTALLRAHSAGDTVVVDEIASQLRRLDADTAAHPLIRRPEPPAPAPVQPVVDAAGEPAADPTGTQSAPQSATSGPAQTTTQTYTLPSESTLRPVVIGPGTGQRAGATSGSAPAPPADAADDDRGGTAGGGGNAWSDEAPGLEMSPVEHLADANEVDGSDIAGTLSPVPTDDAMLLSDLDELGESPATMVLRLDQLPGGQRASSTGPDDGPGRRAGREDTVAIPQAGATSARRGRHR